LFVPPAHVEGNVPIPELISGEQAQLVKPKNIQTTNIREKNLDEKCIILEESKCSIVKALKRKNDIMKSTYYL
jgi:hypothetical protein